MLPLTQNLAQNIYQQKNSFQTQKSQIRAIRVILNPFHGIRDANTTYKIQFRFANGGC